MKKNSLASGIILNFLHTYTENYAYITFAGYFICLFRLVQDFVHLFAVK
jgi:hypothetical protein